MRLHRLLLACLLALFATEVRASVVISWGGASTNYVSTSTNLTGTPNEATVEGLNLDDPTRDNRLLTSTDTDTNDTMRGVSFSTSASRPFSPTSGYTGPTFYGGAVKYLLDTDINYPDRIKDFDYLQIQDHGPNDTIDVRFHASNTASAVYTAIVFKVSEFSGGAGGAPVLTGSTFSITTGQNTSDQIKEFGELRWIVQDSDGSWWISAANAQGDPNELPAAHPNATNQDGLKNNTTYTSSFNAGELTYWAPYGVTESTTTPSTSINFEPAYSSQFVIASGTNPFVAKTFTSILHVGFYIEDDQFTNQVLQYSIQQINFNLVPEPGLIVMLGTVVLAAGIAWLRQRRMVRTAAMAPACCEASQLA